MKLKLTHDQLTAAVLQLRHCGDNIPFYNEFERTLVQGISKSLMICFLKKSMEQRKKYSIKLKEYEGLVLHKVMKHAVYVNVVHSIIGDAILADLDKQL